MLDDYVSASEVGIQRLNFREMGRIGADVAI
jgi:hypothetical protein